jgi:ADP-ribosyl-[dinitrogen reductase] hydrolase
VGDALGAPVEFLAREGILSRFGEPGITQLAESCGRLGAITDDTQMTLLTAEGLIRAHVRWASKGICYVPNVVDHAYARWLTMQGQRSRRWPRDPERMARLA